MLATLVEICGSVLTFCILPVLDELMRLVVARIPVCSRDEKFVINAFLDNGLNLQQTQDFIVDTLAGVV